MSFSTEQAALRYTSSAIVNIRSLLLLFGLAFTCCIPARSGISYEARGRVVDGATGAPIEGATVRLMGARLGRPYSPFGSRYGYPRTCARLAVADSVVAASADEYEVAVRELRADTTTTDGQFTVAVRRGWVAQPMATDIYLAREYDWRWLEVEREGYVPFRSPISEACPETLTAPKVVELSPVR